ncbi:hypothetical protein I3843_03G143000 [Carya illinoinensis]|uniref:Uncharacterized protein n=1 Tax=Carya illinoinensis TaxID=32201 RepID=A0A8T1R2C7_CARIL|nr:hypothetical protein I3760_03G141400 [Carya illinoinensis]KAG6661036.1 hypothetical protein CIPAW_03G147200 [Carya illinoinensis]KAG6722019.1 hypothetical protein I3842_03G141000 [Carya illinoinensis]KAG7987608.1 hypothetical protein I3843_03G143000 [Carya illinoinensis]
MTWQQFGLKSLSGIFSCCYRWDSLRSLRESFSHDQDHNTDQDFEAASPSKSKPTCTDLKHNQSQSCLPVLMLGDQIPKFIALPCPCKPPRPDHEKAVVAVKVKKPPKLPPHFPVPWY